MVDYSISLSPRNWEDKISEELKSCRLTGDYPYLDPYMSTDNKKSFEEFIEAYYDLGIDEILSGYVLDSTLSNTHDRIQIIINCLVSCASSEEELTYALQYIKENGLNEYMALFERRWLDINNTSEDLLKLKLAKSNLNERGMYYG